MRGEREREFQADIVEAIHHSFLVVDADDYTVKMANSAAGAGRLTGSTTCYGLIHSRATPCEGSEHPCPLEAVKRTGKPVTVEHVHTDRDGNARTVEVHAHPVFDRSGTVAQMIEYSVDITERKQLEEALQEREGQYRDLYEEAPIAYFSVGVDGRIRRANRRAEELLGYPLDNLVGRPVFDLYADTAEGKERAQALFQRFRAGGEIRGEELEMRRADDRSVWISLVVRPILNAQGAVVESRSMVIDITERKRAEQVLSDEVKARYNYVVTSSGRTEGFCRNRASCSLLSRGLLPPLKPARSSPITITER